MLICDACEGREDVQSVGIVMRLMRGNYEKPCTIDLLGGKVDGKDEGYALSELCINCREKLVRTIKEAVGPQPKLVSKTESRGASGL